MGEMKHGCTVMAGAGVAWDGKLTPTQCKKFPPYGEQRGKDPDFIDGIGTGSFATAYVKATNPDEIVKFTADRQDAIASAIVAKEKPIGTVTIYDVVELKGQRARAPVLIKDDGKPKFDYLDDQPIFAIAAERVGPLDHSQKAAVMSFWDEYKGEPRDPNAPRNVARRINPRDLRIKDLIDAKKIKEKCVVRGGDVDECDEAVNDITSSVDELASIGIIPLDLHSQNWGSKTHRSGAKSLVILDLGVSAGQEEPPEIRQLAGVGKKGKKMAKRKHRRHLGQTDMAVFDPSQPSRTVGIKWRNPWVIGGAAAALGLVAWLAFGKKDKKKAAASSGAGVSPPLPATGGGGVVIPTTASSTTPTAPVRVRASAGDSWSTLARKYYGNWQWWPALWDANRSGGSKFADPSMLRVGDEIVVPVLPVNDTAFRAAVFARAKAYQTWYSAYGKSKSRPLPASVLEFTSAPTQNAAAGTQVSTQTAAESSSGQKALPPASSSSSSSAPMSAEEKLQSDAEGAWSSLDNTES